MQSVAEEIERSAFEELHSVATAEMRHRLGLKSLTIGSTFVSVAEALPPTAIVLNRAIGLGLRAAETIDSINEIIDVYQASQVKRYFVQIHPDAQPESIVSWLQARGLEKARGWQKFSRGRQAVEPPGTNLKIEQIGPEKGNDLALILSDAFDLGDVARPWIARLPHADKWHVYMTYDGDIPAGTGSVYIDGDCAWMDFGATAPQFRRRGSQSSLLRHRVQFAMDQGCKQMFTCTGEDVPGDPQHSYSNIMRTGFVEDYVRANYAPPKT